MLTEAIQGVLKRLLDAMKVEALPRNVLPFFIGALESLVKCSYSTEVYRLLALFITYTLYTSSVSLTRTPKSSSSTNRPDIRNITRPSAGDVNSPGQDSTQILTKRQVGIKVLEMYSGLLCEKGNVTIVQKFARTVTNKVLDTGIPSRNCRLTIA